MLSTKKARFVSKLLALILLAVFSAFFLAEKLPETAFMRDAAQSVEESSNTVMAFSAATLSASLAISALPDDFATPLAESLADLNIYFIAILVALFLEKLLVLYGAPMVFSVVIPVVCALGALALTLKNGVIRSFALRMAALGLSVALVVPCNAFLTELVASELTAYVEETIADTEAGADTLNRAMETGEEDQTIFEKLSELFQTAMDGMTDLVQYFEDTIRRCMNSVAILLLTNCLMPLLSFFVLRWVLKETFQLTLPAQLPSRRGARAEERAESVAVEE